MILRLLLLAGLAFVVWRLWKSLHPQRQIERQPPPPSFEPMDRCRQCGVHLPRTALSPRGLCGRCST